MPSSQQVLSESFARSTIQIRGNIAAVRDFAPGIVEMIGTGATPITGNVIPGGTNLRGGIMPFFTHVVGPPYRLYLVIPSTIHPGDQLKVNIDGIDYTRQLMSTLGGAGGSGPAGSTPYDGDGIDQIIPGAVNVPGAGDDLGIVAPIGAGANMAPGVRSLVVYEHGQPAQGGGRMFAVDPANATGIAIPAFRSVAAVPPTGNTVGEAILNTTNGLSFIWDGLRWAPIVPPSIVEYPTDTAVLADNAAPTGTYGFSAATGNLFVRYDPGTGAIWRQIGVRIFPTRAGLLAATMPDGNLAFADDTKDFWFRENGNWQPVTRFSDTEANILASTYADGVTAYASDTNQFWYRVGGQWVPGALVANTEANILAATYPNGTIGYATDTDTTYHRVAGAWVPFGIMLDTQANILAATPQTGRVGVATDTGKIYVYDGANWIGQPFREYATEVALRADTPVDGTMAIAVDTGAVFYHTGGNWLGVGGFAIPVGATDPPTPSLGDLVYNQTDSQAKLWVGAAWQSLGAAPGDLWMVGDIKQSVLTEAQFNAALPVSEQSKWVLADGRNVAGTEWARVTGSNNVPDLRGSYLRMAGQNTTNAAWNGGALKAFQEDRTKRPNSAFTTNGSGSHNHEEGKKEYGPQSDLYLYGSRRLSTVGWVGDNVAGHQQYIGYTSTVGNHTHSITGGGDPETRPKTYSVNYFIKIN